VPRPPIHRIVRGRPGAVYYKPRGMPLRALGEVVLGLDEMEALRLADLEGLTHEAAGERMGVSRQTVGRILETARRKVAEALVLGKAIRIEGGPVRPMPPGLPPWAGPGGPGWGGGGRGPFGPGGPPPGGPPPGGPPSAGPGWGGPGGPSGRGRGRGGPRRFRGGRP